MKIVTGHTNLFRRGATYYFRARVPQDIVGTYGQSEEKFSLKTKDYKEAIKRVRIESARVEAKFSEHRAELERTQRPALQSITKNQLKHIYDVYYAHLMEEDEETRLVGFYNGQQRDEPILTFDEHVESTKDIEGITRAGLARGDVETFYLGEAEEVLSWSNVDLKLDPNSLAMRQVARELQKAVIASCESIGKRNEGCLVDTPETPQATLSDSQNASELPLLSEVIELWVKEKSRTSWTENTKKSHEVWAKYFLEVTGDKPLNAYKKSDALMFKNLLLELPANWKHQKAFRGLTIKQAASKASSLGLPPMHLKTAQKNLSFVTNLWNWIAGHYELERNAFQGIRITFKRNPKEERHPFTIDELNRIFSSPVFTGCESKRRPLIAGGCSLKDTEYYWTPLIGLYSGARSNEILQLTVNDIGERDGIYYFDFNKSDYKEAKSEASRRFVPIHSVLIGMGLLNYLSEVKGRGCERLFPDAKVGAYGRYSIPYGRHFSNLLKSIDVKHERNCFHSFRHTFEDACREAGVPKEIMDALQGHTSQDMSATYGAGYSVHKLNEWLQKVDYGGLEVLRKAAS